MNKSLACVAAMTVSVIVPSVALADETPKADPAPTTTAAPAEAKPPPPAATTAPAAEAKAPAHTSAPATPAKSTPAPTGAPTVANAAALTPAAPPAVATAPAQPTAPAAPQPLALRPEKPLNLASETPSSSWGYKFLLIVAVMVAAFVAWKKKRAGVAGAGMRAQGLKVTARASLGMRAEVALVEAGGMKLLVGVSGGAIQTLAVLPDEPVAEEEPAVENVASMAAAAAPIAERARALFASVRESAAPVAKAASRYAEIGDDDPPPPPRKTTEAAKRAAREVPIEGQARGLALALGNRR